LLNGDTTHNRIGAGQVVEKQLKAGREPMLIVEDLFVRCFSRRPSDAERADLAQALDEAGAGRQQVLEDIFWALLNSKEFMFNH
jgi:hypothetical protein